MKQWYDQQHWLIKGIVRCLLYASFFFLFDLLITNNIAWFEQAEPLKEMLFEAMWMGLWFSIAFPHIRVGRFYKNLTTNQDESSGN